MTEKSLEQLKKELEEIEFQIKDLKARWPAHSLKPSMLIQLEDLEEERDRLKRLVEELIN